MFNGIDMDINGLRMLSQRGNLKIYSTVTNGEDDIFDYHCHMVPNVHILLIKSFVKKKKATIDKLLSIPANLESGYCPCLLLAHCTHTVTASKL